MKPSRSQNSQKNDNDPQPQSPSEDEVDNEESLPAEEKESVERNKPIDNAGSSENGRASTSSPLSSSNVKEINVITSEKSIKRVSLPDKPVEWVADLSDEQILRDVGATASGKPRNRRRRSTWKTFLENPKKFAVILSYANSNQQRQPFRPQSRIRPPDPPHYYTSSVQPASRPAANRQNQQNFRSQPQTQAEAQAQAQSQAQSQSQAQVQSQAQARAQSQSQSQPPQQSQELSQPPPREHYEGATYVPLAQTTFSLILSQSGQWAAYPNRIPDGVPPALALLLDTEVLFVIQQLDIFELMIDFEEPNSYLILNKNGECLYYAYETSHPLALCCGGHNRGFQLHFLDLYQNEVIFMNRPCGCTYLCCCYPTIEIYSPPTVPLGAVTKICKACKTSIVIIDPDENVMFTVEGALPWANFEVDMTIHALDTNRTQVGFIRREFVYSPLAYISHVDYYGLSFPGNMDAKIKALCLGALFLIDFMYFEGGTCCQC